MMCYQVYKVLKANKDLRRQCLLTNTIHDSIIFDCQADVLDTACRIIKDTMEDAPKYIKQVFGLDFDLALDVDVEYGRNWLELKTWEG